MASMPKPTDDAFELNDNASGDSIIMFARSAEEREVDRRAGVARFGGRWRSPDYLLAYRHAARVLLAAARERDELDEQALPIFFLQRHATELLLKKLLGWCYDISAMRCELEPSLPNRVAMPSADMRDRVCRCHDLLELWRDLGHTARCLGHEIPPKLGALVDQITQSEAHPTWSRYEPAHPPSQKRQVLSATQHSVPLVEIQLLLDEAVHRSLSSHDAEDNSLEAELYGEWHTLMMIIESVPQGLATMARKTRSDTRSTPDSRP
jgi:hypothetical protein